MRGFEELLFSVALITGVVLAGITVTTLLTILAVSMYRGVKAENIIKEFFNLKNRSNGKH